MKPLLSFLAAVAISGHLAAQVPDINSISPSSGPAGTVVTISGSNFNPVLAGNVVFFGATSGSVTTASPTELTVVVPFGATYQSVTVTTNGLTGYAAPFLLTTTLPGSIDMATFSAQVDFTAGEGEAYFTAVGDLDGDGKPELVSANYAGSTISVFRNTSVAGEITVGTFAPHMDFTAGTRPSGVALGDLDGDGKLDIAVTSQSSNIVSLFRNTSTTGTIDGTSFTHDGDYETTVSPSGVAIADLDSDGKPDVVVANNGGSTVSVYRNVTMSGSVSLDLRIDFQTGANPLGVNVGDLDGDGKPEIVVANGNGNSVSVLRNTTTPATVTASSFSASVDLATGPGSDNSGPQNRVTLADLDGDGKRDLAFVNLHASKLSVFRNNCTPGDISVGTFDPRADYLTNPRPFGVAAADIDGDGKLDLVVANEGPGTASVFRNTSTSGSLSSESFAAKVDFPKSQYSIEPLVADIDGDGRPEVVIGNNGNSIAVLWNAGGCAALQDTEPPIFSRPADITVLANASCASDISISNTGDVIDEADNFSIGLQATYTDSNSYGACPGMVVIIRTWSLVDNCGNNAQDQIQTITVFDNTAPIIAASPPSAVLSADHEGCTAVLPDYSSMVTASDNCSSILISQSPEIGAILPLGENLVTMTATDLCGNSATCEFTVVVVSTLASTFTTTNDWLYFGYEADQSATLRVAPVSGTAPFTVSVSMNRSLICNSVSASGDELWTNGIGTTSASNTVCPSSGPGLGTPVATANILTGGFYQTVVSTMQDAIFTAAITDAAGCAITKEVHIDAEDVRCFAGNSGNQKVTVCHQTGSSKNPCKSLCVSVSAISSHLAHGDFLGSCTESCEAPVANARTTGDEESEEGSYIDDHTVSVYPNPVNSLLTVKLSHAATRPVILELMDITGRSIMVKEEEPNMEGVHNIDMEPLRPGLFMLRIRSGEFILMVKVLKE